MITLITGVNDFNELCSSVDWDCAYVRETHAAKIDDNSFLRIFIVLVAESFDLEIVCFDTYEYSISNSSLDYPEKSITIQRRYTTADFGPIDLGCGCIGYRKLEKMNLDYRQFHYDTQCLLDQNGMLLAPYSVDWKYALDISWRDKT